MAGDDRSGESLDQELMDRVFKQYPDIVRTRWCPMLRHGVINNGKLKSKFGGDKPFRPDNFKWPVCNSCVTKKSFICQLNIETLPSEFQDKIKLSSGLFQLFYCFECIPNQTELLKTKRIYSNVNVVPKTEFCAKPHVLGGRSLCQTEKL